MKPKMLLISNSPTTKVGLRSYLNTIFGSYLELDACLSFEVTKERVEQADLLLYASGSAAEQTEAFRTPETKYFICTRTLNYTYLSKILSIPPGADVYVVNDSECTAWEAIELLYAFGFTQYRLEPWYPGCEKADPSIRHAITIGEMRFVPESIQVVVDIGIRIVGISTISRIAGFFGMSLSIIDEMTKNYMNQFVQLLKFSNHQLSQVTNTRFITQNIISNLDSGVCLTDGKGVISMVNKPFVECLDIRRCHLVGTEISEVIPELCGMTWENTGAASLRIERHGKRGFILRRMEIQDTNQEKVVLFYVGDAPGTEEDGIKTKEKAKRDSPFYCFSDYRTNNPQALQMLETARRIAQTDYRLLIRGETGTGKEVLAHAIHNCSKRCGGPFIKWNLLSMSEAQVLEALSGEEGGRLKVSQAAGGTLYLDGIHNLTERLQKAVLWLLDEELDIRIIASTDCNLYKLCQEGTFLKELFYRINEVSLVMLPMRKRVEDIPLLFEYFMKNIYNNPKLSWYDLCSEGLQRRLLNYSWPGNGKEIENLCKYFYCVKSDRRLTSGDLPPYMLAQMTEKEAQLTPAERQILMAIQQNPKIGRSKLYQLLKEKGLEVTEGKIRGILQAMTERGFIRVNRTKGGCEITEEGEIFLP